MVRNIRNGALAEHGQALLSVAVTVVLIGSLVAFATPTGAVETTLTGPEEVDRNERLTTVANVDVKDGERIPIDAFVLTLRPADGGADESLTVRFAPNGTVLDVTPERGTIDHGDIRIRQFVQSLTITPTSRNGPYGYGYRSGYDEQREEEVGFGYGYGYGYGVAPEFAYDISFDATAFDRGSFVGRIGVDTGEETAFRSEPFEFEVTRPNDDGDRGPPDDDGDGDPDGEPDENGDEDDSRRQAVERFLDSFDGRLSQLRAIVVDALSSGIIPEFAGSVTTTVGGTVP